MIFWLVNKRFILLVLVLITRPRRLGLNLAGLPMMVDGSSFPWPLEPLPSQRHYPPCLDVVLLLMGCVNQLMLPLVRRIMAPTVVLCTHCFAL